MVQVTVDGKEYELDEKQAGTMKYIEEAEALEKGKSVLILLFRSTSLTLIKRPLRQFWTFSTQ